MTIEIIVKVLCEEMNENEVKSDDYINKYQLKKLINRKFPSISEEIIYFAINLCNDKLQPPRKKEDYIKALADVMLEHYPDAVIA